MYNTMKEELLSAIKRVLPEDTTIVTFETFKHGKYVEAFTIKENGVNISPTFYFHHYYSEYYKNVPIKDIAAEIIDLYHFANSKIDIPLNLENFEEQKKKICFKLVNTKEYKAQLPSIPHINLFDLSMIFYGMITVNNEGIATYPITNDTLRIWNVDEDTIYKFAIANTPRLLPIEITDLFSAMCNSYTVYDTLDKTIENLVNDQMLYMVSNAYKTNGFGSILYPDVLQKFGEKFGNFYILPSSIQEALFVLENEELTIEGLKEMVKSVNHDIVSKEEFLSNSVYFYDTKEGKLKAFLG